MGRRGPADEPSNRSPLWQALPGAGTGTVPTPTGTRYTAAASYFRPLPVEGVDATWSSSLQMQTSRAQLDRLLDPEKTGVSLDTIQRAASVVGRQLRIELL